MTQVTILKIGDKVRSFDFSHMRDLEGENACYFEGVIRDIGDFCDAGYQQYDIEVTLQIFGGSVIEDTLEKIIPPANGTPKFGGGVTDFVTLIGCE